jgi:hypothetical protein
VFDWKRGSVYNVRRRIGSERGERDAHCQDAETQGFIQRAGEWSGGTVRKYRDELIAGLCALDRELWAAKRSLDLCVD